MGHNKENYMPTQHGLITHLISHHGYDGSKELFEGNDVEAMRAAHARLHADATAVHLDHNHGELNGVEEEPALLPLPLSSTLHTRALALAAAIDLLEITGKVQAVLASESEALERGDMVAYEALCREEARLMDILKAIWAEQKGD